MTTDSLTKAAKESRDRFLALVDDIRPELHRYCARMMGSVIDGEDVVQDTLARAYFHLPEMDTMPPLRAWLFRVAHNRALDLLRRYDRRMSEDQAVDEVAGDDTPEDLLAREEALHAAASRFVELAPLQRSCVILKDVLGHSAEEIASLLDLSVPAVRAALHRGRARLHELSREPASEAPRATASPVLARYAALMNSRDWDGMRAMLADDVRLDVVARAQRSGRAGVGSYFGQYAKLEGWRVTPAWLEGREVLALYRDERLYSMIVVTTDGARVTRITDYHHVGYVVADTGLR